MSGAIHDLEELHEMACIAGEKTFVDPSTGYSIMTAFGLEVQKKCCGNKCLFCPYEHQNVKNHVCTASKCPFQYSQN